jgi:hypothetical protein
VVIRAHRAATRAAVSLRNGMAFLFMSNSSQHKVSAPKLPTMGRSHHEQIHFQRAAIFLLSIAISCILEGDIVIFNALRKEFNVFRLCCRKSVQMPIRNTYALVKFPFIFINHHQSN